MRRDISVFGLVCMTCLFSCTEERATNAGRARVGGGALAERGNEGAGGEDTRVARGEAEGERELHPDDPGGAARFQAMKRLGTNGAPIPHNALLNAKAQADAMRAKRGPGDSGITGWNWRGPDNIGGRIRAVYIETDPAHAGLMLIGSTGGGIWRSENGGATWAPVSDFLPSLAVTAIVADKSDPSSPVFYASTGEGFLGGTAGANNTNVVRGAGIFYSTDWGQHWTQLASTASSPIFYWVNDLAMSPPFPPPVAIGNAFRAAPRPDGVLGPVLLAATNDGLRYSGNGGASWESILDAGVPGAQFADVDFNPKDPSRAVAGSLYGGRAWISYDMFRNFDFAVWRNPDGVVRDSGGSGRVELAYAPSNPGIVYALVENALPREGRVYRSINGGKYFTFLWSHSDVFGYPGETGSYGFAHNTIWVAPDDPSLVVIGGINLWRSTDGGQNFSVISAWNGFGQVYVHADQCLIVASPAYGAGHRAVYLANDGGLWGIPDIRADPIAPVSLNSGLGITQFYGGTIDGQGRMAGGAQDNGNSFVESGGTDSWTEMGSGDGGFIQSHPAIPDTFFATTQNLDMRRYSAPFTIGIPMSVTLGDKGPGTCNFIAPILLDPVDGHCLYAGGHNLWRLDDPGAILSTWTKIPGSALALEGRHISAIAVSPTNSDQIWLGYNNGTVRRSINGGSSWTSFTALPSRWISDIEVVDTNTAYVTLMGFDAYNVWKTADGGASWQALFGLPSVPVSTIAVKGCGGRLFVGTDLGVFSSPDDGQTWIAPAAPATSSGPVNVQVDELFWKGSDRSKLYAATFGRGMWEATMTACAGTEQVIDAEAPDNGIRAIRHSGSHMLLTTAIQWRFHAYELSASGWVAAPDPPAPAGSYANTFDISGDRAVVTWRNDVDADVVWTYVWNSAAGRWDFDGELVAEGTESAAFGWAVALHDRSIIVGAPYYGPVEDDVGDLLYAGMVVFFRHDGQQWLEEARVVGDLAYFGLGETVGINGNAAVASQHTGGRGDWTNIYEYDSVSGSWSWTQTIEQCRVSGISGDVLVERRFGVNRIYHRNSTTGTWDLEATLSTGFASLFGDRLAVASAESNTVSVRLYQRTNGAWPLLRTWSTSGIDYTFPSLGCNGVFVNVVPADDKAKAHFVPCFE